MGAFMLEVWQSVKVAAEGHARNGEAGVVFAVKSDSTDEVAVRFDSDLQVQLVAVADLVQL